MICEWFVYIVDLLLLCLYVRVLCIYVCCVNIMAAIVRDDYNSSSDNDIVDEYGKKEFPCLAKDLYHKQLITLKRTLRITRMV